MRLSHSDDQEGGTCLSLVCHRVQGSGSRVQGSGFRFQGLGFRNESCGFGVWEIGWRVEG